MLLHSGEIISPFLANISQCGIGGSAFTHGDYSRPPANVPWGSGRVDKQDYVTSMRCGIGGKCLYPRFMLLLSYGRHRKEFKPPAGDPWGSGREDKQGLVQLAGGVGLAAVP